ncbi:MAG: 3-phosphoshikimate 1-carboxyvinyltransferase [Lachnospiraceae bacterium]
MNIKIIPGPLKGSLNAITSKSHAHRLLIAAALCKEPCRVTIHDWNDDLKATENCIRSLKNGSGNYPCGESGSTLRFFLPIVMALTEQAEFYGNGRLPQRPLSPLKEEMEAHGCSFQTSQEAGLIIRVSGKLQGGIFSLAGNVSSQYITGLLFALPLLEQESRIELTSNLESIGYVELTLEVLQQFGIQIEVQRTPFHTFIIKGGQSYRSPGEVEAEGDWSNSAFWIAADRIAEKITGSEQQINCKNLNVQSMQGDKAILRLIEELKELEENHSREDWVIDVTDIPDLVPILSVLAASRKGRTRIINAARLRIKESDRLVAVHDMIEALGGRIIEEQEGLTIDGKGGLTGGTVCSQNDHRIVMAAAIASSLCREPVYIVGAEAVAKSYPDFFMDYKQLGGEWYEY